MNSVVDISLLNSCNFHCSYCISKSSHAEEAPYGRYEMKGAAIEPDPLIEFIKANFNGSVLQLSGGEPLTHVGITYIVKSLLPTNQIVINTNGALIKNVPSICGLPINWRVSVHPEQRELSDLWTHIELITENKSNILLNYVLHPRHLKNRASYALNVIDELERSGIPFEVTGFTGKYNDKYYRAFDDEYDGLITPIPTVVMTEFTSIEADGRLYKCHSDGNGHNVIGCIYTNEYDNERCHHNCVGPGNVSWCPSAISMIRMGLIV